jgi:hypothetical protein
MFDNSPNYGCDNIALEFKANKNPDLEILKIKMNKIVHYIWLSTAGDFKSYVQRKREGEEVSHCLGKILSFLPKKLKKAEFIIPVCIMYHVYITVTFYKKKTIYYM